MRVTALAVLALILAHPSALTVDHILHNYTEPDENITKQAFSLDEGDFVIVSVNGVEMFLFRETPAGASLVREGAELQRVFEKKLYKDIGYEEKKASIEALIREFNASRERGSEDQETGESNCRRKTGTDKYPCVDRESCLFACRSVPICETTVRVEALLFVIRDMVNNFTLMDSLINSMLNDIAANALAAGGSAIDVQRARIAQLRDAVAAVQSSRLVAPCPDCIQYCRFRYNVSALDRADSELAGLKNELAALSSIPGRAAGIKARGDERISYVESRTARLAALASNMVIVLSDLGGRKASLALKVSDPGLEVAYAELRNISDEVIGLKQRGLFERAFRKGLEFERKAGELNASLSQREAEYAALLAAKADTETVLNRADALLAANDSLRANLTLLQEQYAAIVAALSPPIPAANLAPYTSELKKISAEGQAIITQKILTTPPEEQAQTLALSQLKKYLPEQCAAVVPAVILLLYVFAFGRWKASAG
ncbi:MAG: hypothetical protein QXG98_02670 [Candidatus Micrarchaeia archaeon]